MNHSPSGPNAGFIAGAGMNDTLLVIGTEDGFSPLLVDYSLGLAQRMGYSILAVNLLLAGKRKKHHLLSERGRQEMEKFRASAHSSAQAFEEKALAMNVKFCSSCAVGELDAAAREIMEREGNIDLALVEPEYLAEEEDGRLSIPAFTFTL
ncbi:MAG: hypothetical protein OEV92_08120 [Nitrospinota bacterium]|nr:hypothetical protein [Nitrospinota bacterium]